MASKQNTPVAQNTPETRTLYFTHTDRKNYKLVCINPFREGERTASPAISEDDFVALKAGESVPEGYTLHKRGLRDALIAAFVRPQCIALEKAVNHERAERLSKAQYTFDAYALERITLSFSPAASQRKDSCVWDLSCNSKRVNAPVMGEKAVTAGVGAMVAVFWNDCVAMHNATPGCLSGKKFEAKLEQFYAKRAGYTINSRRIHALKGCIIEYNRLEKRVKDESTKKTVVQACDEWGALNDDKVRLCLELKARFASALFADDTTLATLR